MLCTRCSHPLPPRADRCLRCFALNPQNRAGLPLAPPPRPTEAAPRTAAPLGDEAIAGISIASDPPALLPRSGRLDFRFDSAPPSPFRSFEELPGPASDEVRGLVRQLGLPLTPPPPPPPDPGEDPHGAVTEPPDADAGGPGPATLSVAAAPAPAAPGSATLSVAAAASPASPGPATLSVASPAPEPDEAALLRAKLARARAPEITPPLRIPPPTAAAAIPTQLAPAPAHAALATGGPALTEPAVAAPAAAAPVREQDGLVLPGASARIYAWAVDAALIVLCAGLHVAVAAALLGRTVLLPAGPQSADTWADALLFARHLPLCWALLCGCLAVAYSWLFAALGGRTPGMQLAGLRLRRVARGNAGTVSASRALARALLALPATALGLFSPVLALCDARGQSLHDKLTGCQVVSES